MRHLTCSGPDWYGVPEILMPVDVYREPALVAVQQSPHIVNQLWGIYTALESCQLPEDVVLQELKLLVLLRAVVPA